MSEITAKDFTASISLFEHEYSLVWCRQNPELADETMTKNVTDIVQSGFELEFDFSRAGFMTIIGRNPNNSN